MYAGATVAVECKEGSNSNSKANFQQEVKTDEHGEFKVNLPFSVPKNTKRIETCSVKLIGSEPSCSVASVATTSSLQLKSRKQGAHLFSAGSLTFKPLKQPETCKEARPSVRNSKELETQKMEVPVVGDLPPSPVVPELPPLPHLPPLPPLPSVPNLPPPSATADDSKAAVEGQKSTIFPPIPFLPPIPNLFQPVLPPNPFQPPPLLPPNPLLPPPTPLIPNPFQPPPSPLIPNPFQPPPSPSPLIPNPFQPPVPPSPLIPLPPIPLPPPLPNIPGLTPPPPPPPPPAFPIPLPPIHFPPFPGVPPAASNSQKISSP